MITKLKLLRLLVLIVIACLLLNIPSIPVYAQGAPIAKEGLLKSLRKRVLSSKTLVHQVEQRGVTFQLNPTNEQEIRRSGKYLGKRGLDDLIAAIRSNYRQEVNPSRPTETTQSQEKTGKETYISSIVIESRLTCTLKENAELPPSEALFMLLSDGSTYLEGAAGRIPLTFQSPIRFRRQGDNQIVVINRFVLPQGSDIYGRPIESLKNYSIIRVPVITVIYGRALSNMQLEEVSMSLNGQDVWYFSYKIDNVAFQEGPVFEIPLASLHKRLGL